jgi:hypothetical protein
VGDEGTYQKLLVAMRPIYDYFRWSEYGDWPGVSSSWLSN